MILGACSYRFFALGNTDVTRICARNYTFFELFSCGTVWFYRRTDGWASRSGADAAVRPATLFGYVELNDVRSQHS